MLEHRDIERSSLDLTAAVRPMSGNWVFVPVASLDDPSLRDIGAEFWRARWIILVSFVLCLIAGIAVFKLSEKKYTASAVVASVTGSSQGGAIGMLVGKLSGIAGLGGAQADRTNAVLEMLTSQVFLVDFARRHDIVVPLLAARGWDRASRQWQIDPERYDVKTQQWFAQGKHVEPPSDGNIFGRLVSNLKVERSLQTGLITLDLTSYSPEAARDWLTWMINDANARVRDQDIAEANASIEYLQKQLEQTSTTEMRMVLYQLIEDRTRAAMLATVSSDYVLKVVDPAALPEFPTSPKFMTLVPLSGVLGLLLGIAVVFARIIWGKRSAADAR